MDLLNVDVDLVLVGLPSHSNALERVQSQAVSRIVQVCCPRTQALQYIDILSEPTSTTTSTVKNKTSKGSRVVLFRSPEGVSASRRQLLSPVLPLVVLHVVLGQRR